RLFTADEIEWDAGAVLLSYGFWVRRFAADPQVVGRTLTINDDPVTVVGVLPASFDFTTIFEPGSRIDFVAPFPLNERTDRRGNTLALIGRLRPGATVEAAQAEATAIAARPYEGDARRNEFVPRLSPLREHVSGGFRPAMMLLAVAVGLVMLIVCANLSNLLLARGATREREIAIRAALGASRQRLISQMLTESTVLACGGAALGLLLALAGTHMLANSDASIPLLEQVRVDGAALGFTVLAAVVAGLVFGLTPAVRLSAVVIHESLKESGRGHSESRRHGWMRSALVVAEVALACVLLVGAGLLLRSFFRVLDVDLGFQPRGAVTLRIDPQTGFATPALASVYYDDVLRRVRSAPGIEAAGLTDVLPVAFNRRWGFEHGGHVVSPFVRVVSEGYLRAMGLSLISGRDFSIHDNDSGRPAVIVNEILARTLWPGEDPSGNTVTIYSETEWEVVGVVRGMRHLTPEQEPGPEIFFPMRQMPHSGAVHLIARGTGSLAGVATAIRDALRPVDPNLPMSEFRVIQDIIDKSMSPRRFFVLLLVGFAGFALLLASLGIYGVISYSVSQRTQEIGIRCALGASPMQLQKRILTETLRLAAVGMALGLCAAGILARVMRGLLYGVTSSDPITFATVPLLILTVAALAGFVPARRAARLDPAETLRAEPRSAIVG
ncbi:MAG: ABC transporter permease, partial [Gemmatimonadota bacterium]